MASAVSYRESAADLRASALPGGFFEGWTAAPTADEHLELLRNSSHVSIAVDEGRVVGFVNALSDGVLAAYIPLLEVLPEYRGQGISTELIRRLLDLAGPLYMVDVMCDADVVPFYERLGFHPAAGAVIRNYGWRSPE